MTAQRQIPPVRTRRVLVNQPYPCEAMPGVRSQEGQFTFMRQQQAANEACQRNENAEERTPHTGGNSTMFLCVLVVLLAIGSAGAALVVWLAPLVMDALDFFDQHPVATGFAVSGLLIAVLVAFMGTRFLDTKDAE